MKRYQYNCLTPKNFAELFFIVDNMSQISYQEFIEHVNQYDLEDLEQQLGYNQHLELKDDSAVTYYKSKLQNNKTVYVLNYSIMEYIFY